MAKKATKFAKRVKEFNQMMDGFDKQKLDALSDTELVKLVTSINDYQKAREADRRKKTAATPGFQALKKELNVLDAEFETLKTDKFVLHINLPITIKGGVDEDDNYDMDDLEEREGVLDFCGQVTLDSNKLKGLDKVQKRQIEEHFGKYINACNSFMQHFVPKVVSASLKTLAKKIKAWKAKSTKAGIDPDEIINY